MSATTTSTLTTTNLIGSSSAMTNASLLAARPCPTCGGISDIHDPAEAQRRIQELEGHIQDLNERAAVTAGKLANYEEEVHKLRSSQAVYDTPRSSSSRPSSSQVDKTLPPQSADLNSPDTTQTSPQASQSRLATLTSLLPYRRPSATTSTSASTALPTTPTARTHTDAPQQTTSPASSDNRSDLQDALTREQSLRKAAETQLSQTNTELEELTVQLFSQANEMVAQERKARAKLEERVAVLERRDIEKRSRLERLEKAMARVERLKALVNK